jgi:hypothetical protein
MGMIETHVKACKPEADAAAYRENLERKARELMAYGDGDGDKPEGARVIVLTEENFEEHWRDNENLKDTPEIKAKYLDHAKAGRAFAIEIDW